MSFYTRVKLSICESFQKVIRTTDLGLQQEVVKRLVEYVEDETHSVRRKAYCVFQRFTLESGVTPNVLHRFSKFHSDLKLADLPKIAGEIKHLDWRARQDTFDELLGLVVCQAKQLKQSNKIHIIVDAIILGLQDPNIKVLLKVLVFCKQVSLILGESQSMLEVV